METITVNNSNSKSTKDKGTENKTFQIYEWRATSLLSNILASDMKEATQKVGNLCHKVNRETVQQKIRVRNEHAGNIQHCILWMTLFWFFCLFPFSVLHLSSLRCLLYVFSPAFVWELALGQEPLMLRVCKAFETFACARFGLCSTSFWKAHRARVVRSHQILLYILNL